MQKLADNAVLSETPAASALLTLFAAVPVTGSATDQFTAPAIDILARQKSGKREYPNQWHASITTRKPAKAVRFLSIIEVRPKTEKNTPQTANSTRQAGKTAVTAGDYTIRAELDPARPPFLEIRDAQQSTVLMFSRETDEVSLGGTTRKGDRKGMTLMLENSGGEIHFQSTGDRLPDALKYGNLY